jgi:hypothetical protein
MTVLAFGFAHSLSARQTRYRQLVRKTVSGRGLLL